jgi:hypothetical protein
MLSSHSLNNNLLTVHTPIKIMDVMEDGWIMLSIMLLIMVLLIKVPILIMVLVNNVNIMLQ